MAIFQSSTGPARAHLHLVGDRCPTCDQPIPNDRLDEVSKRIAARETQVKAEADARAAELIEARVKAATDAARTEARAELEQVFNEKLAAAEAAKIQAEKSAAEQKAEFESALAERLSETREALEKSKIDAVNAEQVKHFEEMQKTKKLIEELQRKVDKKTAEELGEGAEVDLFETLKGEFPGDKIDRVKKGAAGADIIHEVRHNGVPCGIIVYDSKNHGAWRYDHPAKLREDQLAAKADHAMLVTRMFPTGTTQLHIENGVIIANPARVAIIARLLRKQVVQMHMLKASNQERSRKSDELYSFMTSERFEQFVSTIQIAAKDLDDLQVEERKSHDKVWRRQGEMIAKLKKATNTFDEAVERIIASSSLDREKGGSDWRT